MGAGGVADLEGRDVPVEVGVDYDEAAQLRHVEDRAEPGAEGGRDVPWGIMAEGGVIQNSG